MNRVFVCLLFFAASCAPGAYRRPAPLAVGDTIGIVCLSSRVYAIDSARASRMLDSVGFSVVYGRHVFDQVDSSFGATDADRGADFMAMVRRPGVKAILCYKGGYGAVRALPYVDWRTVRRAGKWIAGYSDVTMLHLGAARHARLETLHATMPSRFGTDSASLRSFDALARGLRGELRQVEAKPDTLNRLGVAEGRLVGGNLSLIYAAAGTPEDVLARGEYVLFIEDVGEYLYHIDRMLQNLERSGKLARCRAVLVGRMTDIKLVGRFGVRRAEEHVARCLAKYNVPQVYGLEVGHEEANLALYMGRKVRVEVSPDGAVVKFL